MISTIVARGFGTFGGGINYLPTRGFTISAITGGMPVHLFQTLVLSAI